MSSYPSRRTTRLRNYDYSQAGAYFVKLCVEQRICCLSRITEGELCLSPAGEMVHSVWGNLGKYYPGVSVDDHVVMPNHLHGIIVLAGILMTDEKTPAVETAEREGLRAHIRYHAWSLVSLASGDEDAVLVKAEVDELQAAVLQSGPEPLRLAFCGEEEETAASACSTCLASLRAMVACNRKDVVEPLRRYGGVQGFLMEPVVVEELRKTLDIRSEKGTFHVPGKLPQTGECTYGRGFPTSEAAPDMAVNICG